MKHLFPFSGHVFLDCWVCLNAVCELLTKTWQVLYVGIGLEGKMNSQMYYG